MTKTIQTQRLKLIPLTLEQLQLLLTNLHQLENELGLAIDKDNANPEKVKQELANIDLVVAQQNVSSAQRWN